MFVEFNNLVLEFFELLDVLKVVLLVILFELFVEFWVFDVCITCWKDTAGVCCKLFCELDGEVVVESLDGTKTESLSSSCTLVTTVVKN